MKIIYIAGLYHTGSTLIDMMLGNLPNVIGLGEIFKGLNDKFEDRCSCGQSVKNCEFWGEITKQLESETQLDLQAKYNLVVEKFIDKYEEDTILVDSSKCHPFKLFSSKDERGMQGLDYLINMPDINIKVIHIVRDVRSWANSLLIRDSKQMKNLTFSKRLFMFIFRSAFARFIQWYLGHKRIMKFLEKNKLEHIRISYEDLAINTEDTFKSVSNFLGIEYSKSILIPSDTKSHIAVGNPMRFRDADIAKIKYDFRWFSSSRLFLPSLILKPIMRFNKKITYSK